MFKMYNTGIYIPMAIKRVKEMEKNIDFEGRNSFYIQDIKGRN